MVDFISLTFLNCNNMKNKRIAFYAGIFALNAILKYALTNVMKHDTSNFKFNNYGDWVEAFAYSLIIVVVLHFYAFRKQPNAGNK